MPVVVAVVVAVALAAIQCSSIPFFRPEESTNLLFMLSDVALFIYLLIIFFGGAREWDENK